MKETRRCTLRLRELRALFAYAVAMGGEILMADVGGAYLHARLRGSAVWARLEKHNQPGWWKRYTDPVVRLHKALYGLKRANFDWDQHHERVMILCSWSRVEDTAGSTWRKGRLLLVVFVDDMAMGGGSRAEM